MLTLIEIRVRLGGVEERSRLPRAASKFHSLMINKEERKRDEQSKEESTREGKRVLFTLSQCFLFYRS